MKCSVTVDWALEEEEDEEEGFSGGREDEQVRQRSSEDKEPILVAAQGDPMALPRSPQWKA